MASTPIFRDATVRSTQGWKQHAHSLERVADFWKLLAFLTSPSSLLSGNT